MARKKNALTEYHVGAIPVDGLSEPEYNRLAKWVSTVTDDSEEEVEDQAFYDGDGTPEDDVISVKKTYTFEGMYDEEDPAMKFVADLEFETGEARKIMFKQVRTNGDVLEGKATVKEIKVTGGEASEYATFECAISWDKKPEITKAGA
ncbi:phage tail protein [Bacillus sp. B15-48]|uniref:phage tail tube protein n=1 Tax=Bacillus sp. B15-48 TaxID=1548601 RepID=UPI00193ED615|nr:phage tail protein [Bacillus sp. B15-48]MBM4762707.1 phage tail protein [Bacillus sp. B15-48]